jgi:hypothetical protein
MTNIEKLTQIGIIGDVRQRYGADDENDTSRDKIINEQDNDTLIAAWCGWHIGDGSWWTTMKHYYDALELTK